MTVNENQVHMRQSVKGMLKILIQSYCEMYQTIKRIIDNLPGEHIPGNGVWMVQDELYEMMVGERIGEAIASLQPMIVCLSQISKTPPSGMEQFFEYFVDWPSQEQNEMWDKKLDNIQTLSENMLDELSEKLYEEDVDDQ